MDTPLLIGLLDPTRADHLRQSTHDLEEAVAQKHIWNTDYESVKYWLSRCYEDATDKLQAQIRAATPDREHPQWEEKDPRWYTIYTPQFSNVASAVKKLQKYRTDPRVVPILPLWEEAGKLSELLKSVKPFVEKGRKPNPNAKPIDYTNTGDCAICDKLQKLDAQQKMVQHGYHISDGFGHYFGFRSGRCFGVGYPPYQLSNKANVDYKAVLDKNLVNIKKRLADLESGAITEITRMEPEYKKFGQRQMVAKIYKQGDDKWDQVLGLETAEVENVTRLLEDTIEYQMKRISDWKLAPLPHGTKAEAAPE